MKRNKIYIILLVVILAAYFGYNYIYQEHRDISAETADYTINASDFIAEFINDSETAQTKYLNKTIVIHGDITAQTDNSITLNTSIFCSLLEPNTISQDTIVSMKGRCIGYDDLLEEIKLDQCTLTKINQ
ncbi:OB-fold protein [Winogradskyella haliclonae]|uniref:tRNA_anti-like n=1 Tax=Winogradskyella haliclonae TaxID=2048558 RepID=A0ABQ2BZJ1_9FLAO|nr:hypothetical protein [Winogradskyella haliclonae]GGI57915.1 hypothetical protein GCM10011444_22240 [Winogradskyella haliclonae]